MANASRGLPRRERVLWSAAIVLLAAVAVAAFLRRGSDRTPAATPVEMRVEITTPPTTNPVSIALSPDGEKLAFVASFEERSKIWVRSLVTGAARPLAGTDDASFPFWSPDSRSIGFFANDRLNRIDIDGGAPKALAMAPVGAGATWNRDHVIVFPTVPDAPLMSVPDTGGPTTLVPDNSGKAGGQRFPQFLPDGRHFLYFMTNPEVRGVYLGSIDGPDRRRLFDADSAAVFVPPAHVLFLRAGTLFKQTFDPVALTLQDNAVPIADGVATHVFGGGAISASAAGSFVYRTGSGNRDTQLGWFDRSGKSLGAVSEPDPSLLNPEISPDGRRVAFNRSVAGNTDIWLLDPVRGVLSRFTSDPFPEIYAVWSPDSRQVVFGRPIGSPGFQLFQRPTEGAGPERSLPRVGQNTLPLQWSKDGRYVLYATFQPTGAWDIGALSMDGGGQPIVVTQTAYDERTAELSPDSRWVAFESNESGRFEIYVQPFPAPGTKTIVSTAGGLQPRWSPDGKELFYVAPDGRLMAVAMRVVANGNIEPSSPIPLFKTRLPGTQIGGSHHEYAIAQDGRRFLINEPIERPGTPITLVLNSTPTKD